MKTTKNLLRSLLILTLLVSLCFTSALAAGDNTVTISSDTDDHTYYAYQVFAGILDDVSGRLTDVTWGAGVDSAALLTALKADANYGSSFTSCVTAADVANVISSSYSTNNAFATAFAKIVAAHLSATHTDSGAPTGTGPYTYQITGLDDGYYFVTEATFSGTVDNSYTKYMLQVVDNVTVNAKTDKPAIALKVLENNDAVYQNTWNDAADYNITNSVPYRIVSIVPDMTYFDTYYYQITDTISSGSTYDTGSAKVYYVSGSGDMYALETSTSTGAGGTQLTSGFTVTPTGSGFTVTFSDLSNTSGVPALGGGYIVVEYTATLNSNAVVGNPGNPTEVYLTYSNNPNNADGSGTGVTPKDEVVVYTFTLPINKVDSSATPVALTGATFAIFTTEADAITAAGDPNTAANFNTALLFSGSAGSYTRSTSGSYTLADNGSGIYSISGLDQGTYYLVEIAAPVGYNRLSAPVTVAIDSSYNDGAQSSAYVDGHIPDATLDQLTGVTVNSGTQLTVINQAGVTLPETGGIGTKVFVVGGLSLILLALILVIARKRSSSEKN
ncbi:MAG: SpaH/EbpB family LPXTG-anchored major pilin [Christensenella sp.]|nr:SpaH/EbpB family LPXTG-anchored major pilin [Christensenella sp.]